MSGNFHQICFVNEVITRRRTSGPYLIRVVGKLKHYSPATAVGELVDSDNKTAHILFVDFKNCREIPLYKGSYYQITGQVDEETLKAKTVRNVDGIDLQMYKEAVLMRRQFLIFLKVIAVMPKLKQATISSLKGVVILEDFRRHKNVLENASESKANVLMTLQCLKKKKPSKEVLSSTGIEKSLEALFTHTDDEIGIAAKNLYEYWELNSKKTHPTIEVRYDNLTRHIRRNALKLFTEALGRQEEDEKVAEVLEREIFHQHKRLISKHYRKCVRKIVFVLRHNESEKIALKRGSVTQLQFVKKYLQPMK